VSDAKAKDRLFSLDLLRGLDMFLLCCFGMFVGTLQCAWPLFPQSFMEQLRHGPTGFRLWDIIMPLFIFMCGAAVPFAMGKRLQDGRATPAFWKHLVIRFAMLWVLGMVVQGDLLSLDPMRISSFSNTLQTIAIGYAAASLTLLIRNPRVRWAIPILCFIVYGILLHVGGHGDYSAGGNLAMRVDKWLFAFIVPAGNPMLTEPLYAWVLPSFMYVAMTLMGLHSAEILSNARLSLGHRAGLLTALAAACLALGAVSSIWIPLVKPIYTVSFTFYACGWCMLALAVLFVLTDILKFRRGLGIFILYGQVALAAYIVTHVFRRALGTVAETCTVGFERFVSHEWRMVLYVVVYVAVLTFVLYVWRAFKKGNR